MLDFKNTSLQGRQMAVIFHLPTGRDWSTWKRRPPFTALTLVRPVSNNVY